MTQRHLFVDHENVAAEIDGSKFGDGNTEDGKHYWLTPPDLYAALDAEFHFDFDPCPYPLPDGFDGLTCAWGRSNYVNPPFGSIIHQGRKKGPTAWVRKAIEEHSQGKTVVLVYPVDKWVLMMLKAILGDHAGVRNLGDVRWLATEDGSQGNGTGRHVAAFILTTHHESSILSPGTIVKSDSYVRSTTLGAPRACPTTFHMEPLRRLLRPRDLSNEVALHVGHHRADFPDRLA